MYVSTTPLWQWGFLQCLPFSWIKLRDKHCWYPIAVMGVVDTVNLGNKERFDKEQSGIKEPFPVTNLPFTS